MHRKKTQRWLWDFKSNWIMCFILCIFFAGCSSAFHPYKTSFKCPASYGGLCEQMQDAYFDSVHGIDPAKFDKNFQKRMKKWEKLHKKLLKARKKIKKQEIVQNQSGMFYRKELFRELSTLLTEPEKPFLIPPKVCRVLVLSSLARDAEFQNDIYISPHYVYFMLDKPRWLLHKIPETVPFDPENPMIQDGR